MKEKVNLKVDLCSYEAAKYACLNWHYSKSMPAGKIFKVGAWENKKFIGCVLFSYGANPNLLSQYNLKQNEGCELTRIALSKHKSFVSEVMSKAFKLLKKTNNKLRLVVSFSDLDQNHHGGIYQATNWIYQGLYCAGTASGYIVNGKKRHRRNFLGGLSKIRKKIDPNTEKFITKGKHKYLMPLDKKMRKQILPLSKTYPKCEKIKENYGKT